MWMRSLPDEPPAEADGRCSLLSRKASEQQGSWVPKGTHRGTVETKTLQEERGLSFTCSFGHVDRNEEVKPGPVSLIRRYRDPQWAEREEVLCHARVPEPPCSEQGPDPGVCAGPFLRVCGPDASVSGEEGLGAQPLQFLSAMNSG